MVLAWQLRMESWQSFNIPSCLQTKIAWFNVTDSVKDENVPWNCNQITLASPKHQKQIKMHRQKGKDVKYTGITVEARVKKIISQCSKTNVSHVVGVFLKRILWEFVTCAYSDILHWYKVFGDKVYLWKENSSFQLLI